MNIQGSPYRSIWFENGVVQIIDQRFLPHKLVIEKISTVEECARAIEEMHVRGAPLIGATAAFGMYLAVCEAMQEDDFDAHIAWATKTLAATRPTAVDLFFALDKANTLIQTIGKVPDTPQQLLQLAKEFADEVVEQCRSIGEHGKRIIQQISKAKNGEVVNILTHCNAGWLATVDYGTALAPIFMAFDAGVKVHVWVDETRPRNQGARLTAFELAQHGIPHTVIADNTGGHLMQHQMVDMVITGSDRTTRNGDVANKIGTYLKALAAKDNDIPFYVALPYSTIDWTLTDGVVQIPIEERSGEEVSYIQGLSEEGIIKVRLTPKESPAINYGFDVTPARLVTGLITERGCCTADEKGLLSLYPEHK